MLLPRRLLLTFCFLSTVSCRSCHETGPQEILSLAPKDSAGLVLISDLKAASRGFEGLLSHATHKAGGGAVRRLREGLSKQLGFDPLNADALGQIGLRPQSGALIFAEVQATAPLLALGVADKDTFERTLRAMITRIDGADQFKSSTHQGRAVITAGRPFGNTVTPAVHWAYVGDWILLARGDQLDVLDHALGRLQANAPPSATLKDDAVFNDARHHLSPGFISIFARGNDGANISSSWMFGADGFSGDTLFGTADANSLAFLGDAPVLPLAADVPVDAALVLVSRAATLGTWQAMQRVPGVTALLTRGVGPMQTATGLRLAEDILPLLAGPITLSVQFADTAGISARLRSITSPQAALDFVHVAFTAELRDPKTMSALLTNSQARMKEHNIALRARAATVKGAPTHVTIFEPDTDAPKLGWTVFGNRYVYGAGPGSVDATLERLSAGDSGLAALLNRGVVTDLASSKGALLVLRGGQIAAAIDRARQGDPGQSMGINGILSSVAEVLRTLDDVALSLDTEAGGLRLRAREQLQ